MKLLVRKLWFKGSVDDTITSLFRIPQLKGVFDGGYAHTGEMRPRGIKICPGYWPADAIIERLPDPKEEVYLVLTSMALKGDYLRIHGKGRERKALASNDGFLNGFGTFYPDGVDFNAMTFGEIGHALGLSHHGYEQSNPCEMSHGEKPGPVWESLEEIRFCDDCYKKLL